MKLKKRTQDKDFKTKEHLDKLLNSFFRRSDEVQTQESLMVFLELTPEDYANKIADEEFKRLLQFAEIKIKADILKHGFQEDKTFSRYLHQDTYADDIQETPNLDINIIKY